jgi:hypothetical protein
MKSVLLSLLARIVKALIDAKLFEAIQELVILVGTRSDLSGDEKKQFVIERLEQLRGDLSREFQKAGRAYINFAIESAVVLFKEGRIG